MLWFTHTWLFLFLWVARIQLMALEYAMAADKAIVVVAQKVPL